MTNPLVSCVIPTYNYGRYISRAIDSVLGQTYANIEVIVVDDGSTDCTANILRSFKEKFGSRIYYIYQENAGVNAARNRGISCSNGDYIAFLDADDEWISDKIEKQLNAIQADVKVGMVGCGYKWINDEGIILAHEVGPVPPSQDMLIQHLLLRSFNFGGSSSVLIRKQCFLTIGFFDEILHGSEDRDMWLRIVKQYTAVNIPDVCTIIHYHDDNSHTNYTKMLRSHFQFIRKHYVQESMKKRLRAISYAYLDAAREAANKNHRVYLLFYSMAAILFYPLKTMESDDKYILLLKSFLPQKLISIFRKIVGSYYA